MKTTLRYRQLTDELQQRIISDRQCGAVNPYRCNDNSATRRNPNKDLPSLLRPAFVRDSEKILHLPVYNRYADKTQVISLYKNDDITRRAQHVQLVSRIARDIGAALNLNLDLIEAIALGHDIGHTPFGHAGERYLSELLYERTGLYFNHNVHSVRVLDGIYRRNLTLQTLDGIICHNGEFPQQNYKPAPLSSFDDFDSRTNESYLYDGGDPRVKKMLIPSTLEGCVVRVCDIIAYIGKDRQDARTAKIIDRTTPFSKLSIGSENAEFINNLTVDIVENSYGTDSICMSKEAHTDLLKAKKENFEYIYKTGKVNKIYDSTIKPMFSEIFSRVMEDLICERKNSPIWRHHIAPIMKQRRYYSGDDYLNDPPEMIAADYIASMTDDYFIDLYDHLFPNGKHSIEYKSYFDELTRE